MSETIWNTDELIVVVDDEVELQDAWNKNYIDVPVDEFTAFAEHWLEQRGYDVAKREPELLPCPACGSKAQPPDENHWKVIQCISCTNPECEMTGPVYDPDGVKWNALPRKEER